MSRSAEPSIPYAYFLTFTTYGSWLPGDERFSVNRKNNIYNTPRCKEDAHLRRRVAQRLKQEPLKFNTQQRRVVLNTIISVSEHYQWLLFAAHIRTNHVHIVLQSDTTPEFAMKQMKAYGTRELRRKNVALANKKIWTRHGSTRYIWKPNQIFPAVKYTIEEQGDKLAFYYDERFHDALYFANDDFLGEN